MIVDSSVILANSRSEPEILAWARAIERAASRRFGDLIREANFLIDPATEEQAHFARAAHRDFGRGSGHPAKLNFAIVSRMRSPRRRRAAAAAQGSGGAIEQAGWHEH